MKFDNFSRVGHCLELRRAITSHLNSLSTKKSKTYYVGIPGPGLGQAHTYGRVYQVNGIPILPTEQTIRKYHVHLNIYHFLLIQKGQMS